MFKMLYKLDNENEKEMLSIQEMKAHEQEWIQGAELRHTVFPLTYAGGVY